MTTAPISAGEKPRKHPACIWKQAGVVRRKECRLQYDCVACHFDKIMARTAEKNRQLRMQGKSLPGRKGQIVSWKDKLKEIPSWKQPCLHFMKGRIDFRTCNHGYRCGKCEFDQYFLDQYNVHALIQTVDVMDVQGFKIPQGYYLHPGHAWLKIEDGAEVRVGIDDFALRLLGPMDQLEMPLIGKTVKQGRPYLTIRRGGHQATLLSPVSGIVVSANASAEKGFKQMRPRPYDGGWVLRIHANNLRADLKNLLIGEETEVFLKREIDQLYEVIEAEAGPLAADGGNLGYDIAGNLPEKSWPVLVKTFLGDHFPQSRLISS